MTLHISSFECTKYATICNTLSHCFQILPDHKISFEKVIPRFLLIASDLVALEIYFFNKFCG